VATLLKRLRKQARLSQRALADLGDVSQEVVARIERGFDPKTGGPVRPRPDTLRGIAKGLATSGDGTVDPVAERRIYRELFSTAGYELPGEEPLPSPPTRPTVGRTEDPVEGAPLSQRDQTLAEIDILIKKIPDASIALTDLARGAQDWDEEDAEFVRNRLRRLAEQFGRSQAAC
jgi:transcriptional regulator with XRE-family HTH domain